MFILQIKLYKGITSHFFWNTANKNIFYHQINLDLKQREITYHSSKHANKLHVLWNTEVQCRIHKGSPIIPILSRINPIPRMIPIPLRSIVILSSHLRLGLPKSLFPAGLPITIFKTPSYILATWPAHLNLLDLITLTIFGVRYNQWSSSLWSLLHSPFSSPFDPNIRLRILFSNTLSQDSSLNVRDHVSQP